MATRDDKYCVYMLRCANGAFYTGVTNDIERRLKQHNGELPGGAKYTQANRPVVLVFSEELSSKSEAMQREYEIKQLTRKGKSKLVATNKA